MRSICRTFSGSGLQVARHLGTAHVIPENGTLNQWVPTINKFGMTAGAGAIQPRLTTGSVAAFSLNSYNPAADTPSNRVNYLAIGCMGHTAYIGPDNNTPSWTGPLPHMARHTGMYGQLPFALCLPGNDLPALERAKYRFRTWITVGGQQYIAYFLRKLDLSAVTVETKYVTVTGGTATSQTFSPTSNDLVNPTKPGQPGAPILTTGDYLSTTASMQLQFTATEVARLLQVSEILFNNPNMAIISEFAICQGLDKDCHHSWNGSSIDTSQTHPEAIGVQISTFMTAYYPLVYTNDGFQVAMNLGALEPLYGVTAG